MKEVDDECSKRVRLGHSLNVNTFYSRHTSHFNGTFQGLIRGGPHQGTLKLATPLISCTHQLNKTRLDQWPIINMSIIRLTKKKIVMALDSCHGNGVMLNLTTRRPHLIVPVLSVKEKQIQAERQERSDLSSDVWLNRMLGGGGASFISLNFTMFL